MNLNNYSTSTSTSDLYGDMLNNFKKMQEGMDRDNNPNGRNNKVIRLDNFQHGQIRLYKQPFPGTKPVLAKVLIFDGGNRLSLNENFVGVIVGLSKNPLKKYEFEFIGFDEIETKKLQQDVKVFNRR